MLAKSLQIQLSVTDIADWCGGAISGGQGSTSMTTQSFTTAKSKQNSWQQNSWNMYLHSARFLFKRTKWKSGWQTSRRDVEESSQVTDWLLPSHYIIFARSACTTPYTLLEKAEIILFPMEVLSFKWSLKGSCWNILNY